MREPWAIARLPVTCKGIAPAARPRMLKLAVQLTEPLENRNEPAGHLIPEYEILSVSTVPAFSPVPFHVVLLDPHGLEQLATPNTGISPASTSHEDQCPVMSRMSPMAKRQCRSSPIHACSAVTRVVLAMAATASRTAAIRSGLVKFSAPICFAVRWLYPARRAAAAALKSTTEFLGESLLFLCQGHERIIA